MHRHRSLIFGLIAVVAGIVVLATRPLTVSVVGWSAFWAAVAVVVVTLVERPDRAAAAADALGPPAVAAPAESGSRDT